MKRQSFSKVFVFFILAMFVFALEGCALFQKPPTDPNAKKAWVESSQTALENAATGESIALVAFTVLCAGGTIPAPACIMGNALDATFQGDYLAAKDALDKYAADQITQIEAQRLFDQAMLKSLASATAFLRTNSAAPAAQGAKMIRDDSAVPTGQTTVPLK
jgi:hypothetical protein